MWFLVHCYEDEGKIDDAVSMCEELAELIRDFGGEGLGQQHKLWQYVGEKKEELLSLKDRIGKQLVATDERNFLQTHSSSRTPPKKVVKDLTF